MRILAIRDEGLEGVEEMLEGIKDDYKSFVSVSWKFIDRDLSELRFEEYMPGSRGLSRSHISKTCAELFKQYGYQYDHVIWFFKRENWDAPGIGGWNLGRLYSNYAVQLVLSEQRSKWAGKTLKMEIAHAFDEFTPIELGINLDRLTGLDWDNDIVHGEHPDWGVWSVRRGKYWTNYNYTKMIRWYGYIFNNICSKRREKQPKAVNKQEIIIQLMIKVRRLLRLIIQAKGAVPTALLLEGEHKH